MSASSSPTRWPRVVSARARLTEVVDLPTPPLPEATATMAAMPGSAPRLSWPCGGWLRGAAPRRGGACAPSRGAAAGGALGGEHRGDRGHAGERHHRRLAGGAQRLLGGSLARVDLEGEADIAVAHDHARHHSERDHVLALPRVLDPGERRQNLLLGDLRHG